MEILRAVKNNTQVNQSTPHYLFADLVDRYSDSVYRFCRSLTYSKEDADDLFQETFLGAFEQLSKLNASDNPQGFLFSTALYLWKSWKRKYARRNRLAPVEPMDETVVSGVGDHAEAFIYNEQTGELKSNPDYDGSSVVFDLPLDKSLADPEKAQRYLDTMWDNEDATPSNAGETASDVEPIFSATLTENGSVSKQVMTYDTLKKWIDDTLAETQKMVDNGEYSKANMELDRQGYSEKLTDIEKGNIVTLYNYADGSYSLATTYPDSGFDADVGANGEIVITNR